MSAARDVVNLNIMLAQFTEHRSPKEIATALLFEPRGVMNTGEVGDEKETLV